MTLTSIFRFARIVLFFAGQGELFLGRAHAYVGTAYDWRHRTALAPIRY